MLLSGTRLGHPQGNFPKYFNSGPKKEAILRLRALILPNEASIKSERTGPFLIHEDKLIWKLCAVVIFGVSSETEVKKREIKRRDFWMPDFFGLCICLGKLNCFSTLKRVFSWWNLLSSYESIWILFNIIRISQLIF